MGQMTMTMMMKTRMRTRTAMTMTTMGMTMNRFLQNELLIKFSGSIIVGLCRLSAHTTRSLFLWAEVIGTDLFTSLLLVWIFFVTLLSELYLVVHINIALMGSMQGSIKYLLMILLR